MELLFATMLVALIIPTLLTRKIQVQDLFLVFGITTFTGGAWLAYFNGGFQLPDANGWQLFLTYCCIFFFFLGIAVSKYISVSGRSGKLLVVVGRLSIPDVPGRFLLSIFSLVWLLRYYRATKYGILFSGSRTEEAILGVDYWFVIAYSLASLLVVGAIITLIAYWHKHKWLALLVFPAEVIWTVMNGRREALLLIMFVLIGRLLSGRRFTVKSLSFFLFVGVVFLQLWSGYFLAARNAIHEAETTNILNKTAHGLRSAVGSGPSQLIVIQQQENLSVRPISPSRYILQVVERQEAGMSMMFGEAIWNSVLWTIPSAIVTKPALPTEQLIQSKYNYPQFDQSISWPAVAVADFGIVGCLFYGYVLGAVVGLLFGLVARLYNTSFLLSLFLGGLVTVAFFVESDPILLFGFLREYLIIVIIWMTLVLGRRYLVRMT